MKDRNGKSIAIGAKAVMLQGKKQDPLGLDGKIGEVRDIKLSVGALRGKPGLRVSKGPEGNYDWSAWVLPNEVAIID